MKKFLSKNWKNILILIAGVFIVINVISKCMAPRTLVNEFGKYGPDIERKNYFASGSIKSGDSMISGENGILLDNVGAVSSSLNGEMVKIALFIACGLLVAVVLTELGNKKPSSGKKK